MFAKIVNWVKGLVLYTIIVGWLRGVWGKIKSKWQDNPVQVLGAVFLVVAFVLGCMREPGYCSVALLCSAVSEGYLLVKKFYLITRLFQHFFGKTVDTILIFVCFGIVLWVFWNQPAEGWEVINFSGMGILKGHFFANGN